MSDLYDQGVDGGDGHDTAADVSAETDNALRPVDEIGQESWAEDAEPLTRGEYADQVRQGLTAGEADNTDRDYDHDGAEDQGLAGNGQEQEVLPEPRTRQEVAEEARRTDTTVPDHAQAAGTEADLDASSPEEDQLPEPRTRQEVAEQTRSGVGPLTSDAAAPPEYPAQSRTENPPPDPDQHEQHSKDLGDSPFTHLTVTQAEAADRTLGDTTPTGIGLKPTGEQLLEMDDDRGRNRWDRVLDEAVKEADDVYDLAGHIAEPLAEDFKSGPAPSDHQTSHHAATSVPDLPQHGSEIIDVAGSIALVGLAIAAGVRHGVRRIRKGRRSW